MFRWSSIAWTLGVASAFVGPYQSAPGPSRRRTAAVGASREDRIAALESSFRRSSLEALVKQTPSSASVDDESRLPVHFAPWTYVPGCREVLRVHAPALTYLFTDVVLPSRSRSYVHALRGTRVGVEMRVLDCVASRTEHLALVHATRRVRIVRDGETDDGSSSDDSSYDRVGATARVEPLLDREEQQLASRANTTSGTVDDDEAARWAARWAAYDDPLTDFAPTWPRDGGRRESHVAPWPDVMIAADDEAVAPSAELLEVEAAFWAEVDAYVGLVRRSRTSGRFDVPARLARLRRPPPTYPARRRLVALSFAVDALLDLDRSSRDAPLSRQAFLELDSTEARLRAALGGLEAERKQLAAFLSVDALRRGTTASSSSSSSSSSGRPFEPS